jgi:hypothetical protein
MGNSPLGTSTSKRGEATLETLEEPLLQTFEDTALGNLSPATNLLPSHDGPHTKRIGPPRFSRDLFGWVRIELPGLEELRTPALELAFRKRFFEKIARKDGDFHLPFGAAYDEAMAFANEYLQRLCECGIDSISICAAVQLSSDSDDWLGTMLRVFITDCVRGRARHGVREAELRQAADHIEMVAAKLTDLVGCISTDWCLYKTHLIDFDMNVAKETEDVWLCANHYDYQPGGPIAHVVRHGIAGKAEGLIEPKALAFMRLLHSVASEYLTILRSSNQIDHAILAARAAVALDTANTKYFPNKPRIEVDDIIDLLADHARQAFKEGRSDELTAFDEAIRSLTEIAPDQVEAYLASL